MIMKKIFVLCFALVLLFSCNNDSSTSYTPPEPPTRVWTFATTDENQIKSLKIASRDNGQSYVPGGKSTVTYGDGTVVDFILDYEGSHTLTTSITVGSYTGTIPPSSDLIASINCNGKRSFMFSGNCESNDDVKNKLYYGIDEFFGDTKVYLSTEKGATYGPLTLQ